MKKRLINKQWAIVAMAIMLTAIGSGKAYAVPLTASGSTVVNSVKLTFTVAEVEQAAHPTASCDFKVDTIVDLTVTHVDLSSDTVAPGQTKAYLQFKVANTGNAQQAFKLTTADYANPTPDDFNVVTSSIDAFVESGQDTTKYNMAPDTNPDTNTEILHLNANTEIFVWVVADIPTAPTNTQEADVYLLAQACIPGTTTVETNNTAADGEDTVEVVLGDGKGGIDDTIDNLKDGKYAAFGTYKIGAANLTVTKTSTVISDPINGTGAARKRIPGAIVEYTITVSNAAGAATATNLEIRDQMNNEVFNKETFDYVTDTMTLSVTNCGTGTAVAISDDDTDANENLCGAKGSYTLDAGTPKSALIKFENIKIDADKSAVAKFRVKIRRDY